MHHAAIIPAMAPLAPREVTASLLVRTCVEREAKEARTPVEVYRARKSPRPTSSWTRSRHVREIVETIQGPGGTHASFR